MTYLANLGYLFLQVATLIAVYCSWGFARIEGVGWGWAGVIWIYSIVTYFPLDIFKFIIRYALTGKAWDNIVQNKVCFSSLALPKKRYSFHSFHSFPDLILLANVLFTHKDRLHIEQ